MTRNIILKIVGDNTKKYVQGYFQYDSKKSGGVTRSHIRISDKPIISTYYIDNPSLVVCSKESYLGKYDMKLLKNYINTLVWKTSSYDKIGVFCYHDLLAYDVVNIIDNFSIVGFDNLSIASVVKPSLTTVYYPLKEMATKGIVTMIDCLNNQNHKPRTHKVLCALVERNTTI